MKNSITQKMRYKHSVIKFSFKYGVTKTSIKFNISRRTIYRWIKAYDGTKHYKAFNVFKQENMKKDLKKLLLDNGFSRDEIEKILYRNFKDKILERL